MTSRGEKGEENRGEEKGGKKEENRSESRRRRSRPRGVVRRCDRSLGLAAVRAILCFGDQLVSIGTDFGTFLVRRSRCQKLPLVSLSEAALVRPLSLHFNNHYQK